MDLQNAKRIAMVKNICICLLIMIPMWVQAENENAITIRGQVVGTTGNPLPGANIVIVDTPYNNIANKNGKYVLTVPGTERDREITLKVSFVGYISQSMTLTLPFDNVRQDFRLVRDLNDYAW